MKYAMYKNMKNIKRRNMLNANKIVSGFIKVSFSSKFFLPSSKSLQYDNFLVISWGCVSSAIFRKRLI